HRASRLLDATASRLPLLRLAFLSVRHAGALVILTQQVKQGISHNGSPTDPLRWHITGGYSSSHKRISSKSETNFGSNRVHRVDPIVVCVRRDAAWLSAPSRFVPR